MKIQTFFGIFEKKKKNVHYTMNVILFYLFTKRYNTWNNKVDLFLEFTVGNIQQSVDPNILELRIYKPEKLPFACLNHNNRLTSCFRVIFSDFIIFLVKEKSS